MDIINKTITITSSPELIEMRLLGAVGKRAKVLEDLTQVDRKSKGFLVRFAEPYLKYRVWYIPKESIKYE